MKLRALRLIFAFAVGVQLAAAQIPATDDAYTASVCELLVQRRLLLPGDDLSN